jgi:uncharacterized membrane protein
MTPGLGFALGAMACFGVSDLIYKRGAAAGIKAGEFLLAQASIFCPGVTLYAWATGNLVLQRAALWGALAGAFLFVALYNFTKSLQGGAVSTNAPIFRLNFTITAALAILILGETFTVTKAVALGAALVAVWLLLAEAGAERSKADPASLVRVLVATVAMASTNFFYKVGLLAAQHPKRWSPPKPGRLRRWLSATRHAATAASAFRLMPCAMRRRPRSRCSALSCCCCMGSPRDRRAYWCLSRK